MGCVSGRGRDRVGWCCRSELFDGKGKLSLNGSAHMSSLTSNVTIQNIFTVNYYSPIHMVTCYTTLIIYSTGTKLLRDLSIDLMAICIMHQISNDLPVGSH